ncbi:MAG: threonine ammonia-lyase, biosynthetic [Magnetococcales bacterium]|nr:threonine ammonia-lyase, biosynthetic [Magnetococcales bacterium]
MLDSLLRLILTARVYEAAVETPLEYAPSLSESLGNTVFLKREDLQPVFSFKLRGAYNKIANLSDEDKSKGIIAASAGNHAQGVAYSAKKLNLKALIIMPLTTPTIKVEAVRRMGAQVQLHGDNYSEAAELCNSLAKEKNMTFIHPFDDELIIAGQGTVGDEIMRQSGGRVDAIFIPIGGGGLISGVAAYVKALNPNIKIIGVEPEDSDAMARSLAANELVELDSVGIFADGVAVRKVGKLTFDLCQKHIDEVVRVNTDAICGAIKASFLATRAIVEPAGALALAGLQKWVTDNNIQGQRLVAINSGANMNFERLRYIAERTLVGEQREALFAVSIPEKPDSLRRFCDNVVEDRNITEFRYRLATRSEAHIFFGMTMSPKENRQDIIKLAKESGFNCTDLTENELAKTHVRHMVGGRAKTAKNERLFRFWFPERPGALSKFLNAMGKTWNISLFHYRLHGTDFGRVLIGLEIPENQNDKLTKFLADVGYRYQEESDNPAYKLFL